MKETGPQTAWSCPVSLSGRLSVARLSALVQSSTRLRRNCLSLSYSKRHPPALWHTISRSVMYSQVCSKHLMTHKSGPSLISLKVTWLAPWHTEGHSHTHTHILSHANTHTLFIPTQSYTHSHRVRFNSILSKQTAFQGTPWLHVWQNWNFT